VPHTAPTLARILTTRTVRLVTITGLALSASVIVFASPPLPDPARAYGAAATDGPTETGELMASEDAAYSPTVDVIARTTWGASTDPGPRIGQVDQVIVHHFWRPAINDVVPQEIETDLVQRVDRKHAANGWSGIGYSFVVFQSGRVYEGRGWGRQGAHTVGENDRSIGIAFAIDGDTHHPTEDAWEAAKGLVADGIAAGHLAPDVRITGHADYAPKSCPGDNIAPRLDELLP
jgi:peptidoglycan recognition protein